MTSLPNSTEAKPSFGAAAEAGAAAGAASPGAAARIIRSRRRERASLEGLAAANWLATNCRRFSIGLSATLEPSAELANINALAASVSVADAVGVLAHAPMAKLADTMLASPLAPPERSDAPIAKAVAAGAAAGTAGAVAGGAVAVMAEVEERLPLAVEPPGALCGFSMCAVVEASDGATCTRAAVVAVGGPDNCCNLRERRRKAL